jgi:uncharacterized protein YkwD
VTRKTLLLIIILAGPLMLIGGIMGGAWLAIQFDSSPAMPGKGQYTALSAAAPAPTTPSPTAHPLTPTPTRGSNPGNPAGPSSNEQQIAQAVFQAINASRAAAGHSSLQWGAALAAGARKHDLKMSAADQLSHQLAGEPALGTRITQDGVHWSWCGENIGDTSSTSVSGALGLHSLMMAEQPPNDGHRQNILSTNYTMVGVDILIDSHHRLWLTEDFAN